MRKKLPLLLLSRDFVIPRHRVSGKQFPDTTNKMRNKLLLLGFLGSLMIILACGKKGPPTPRDQVLQKQNIEQNADKR